MNKNIENIEIVKKDDRGIIYDCGKVGFIIRKKGTISADHKHDQSEILYIIKGEIDLTIDDDVRTVKAPVKIHIPANTYHKLYARTEIMLVEDKIGFEEG